MRILYVGTYASWEKVSEDKMPAHHMFGVHGLIEEYIANGKEYRATTTDGDTFDFYLIRNYRNLPKRINQILNYLILYFKSFSYDCIYDTLNQCTKIFSILRKYHLMKAKIVGILHHPPFDLEVKYGGADAYVFFDKQFYDYACALNPKLRNRFYINEWWPDKSWYERKAIESDLENYSFYIDNGKTKRDHDMVVNACTENQITCMMPGPEENSTQFIKYYTMDLKDDIGMAKRLRHISAILIPVKNQKAGGPMGPYGITSFMDAMALRLPVICSDNCCFAHYVKDFELGICYKTGDENSLSDAIKRLYSDKGFYEKCVQNMDAFATDKDVSLYSANLRSILNDIRKKK